MYSLQQQYWLYFTFVMLYLVGDTFTTWFSLRNSCRETNVIVASLLPFGYTTWISLKVICTAVLFMFVSRIQYPNVSRMIMICLNLVMACVVGNNLVQIIRGIIR